MPYAALGQNRRKRIVRYTARKMGMMNALKTVPLALLLAKSSRRSFLIRAFNWRHWSSIEEWVNGRRCR
jgi:hypothetical protein